ncbi:RNA-directed DNA polymerase [Methylobacterium brachiatum]
MFVLRALNHSRRDFLPTYVGLRHLLDGLKGNHDKDFIRELVKHRSSFDKNQKYFSYEIYKSADEEGNFKYRNCSYPSPLSVLVEAHALCLMADSGVFNPSASVYSYRWPGNKSGHMFKYFFDGYRDRHASVSSLLSENGSGYVVITADILSFYPNTSKESVVSLVEERLSQCAMDKNDKKSVAYATQQLLSSNNEGLPVGPPLSHALANLALDELDDVLFKEFGSNYFRYVDDIAVVVSKHDAGRALGQLESIVSDFGYSFNSSKTDILDLTDWSELLDEEDPSLSFADLRDMLAELAITQPNKLNNLSLMLKEEGFNLPISHMARVSRGTKWQQYFKGLLRIGKNKLRKSLSYGQEDYILGYAKKLRKEFEQRIDSGANIIQTSVKLKSARQTRKLLRNVQCMLYMYRPNELGFLLQYVPHEPGTANILGLLEACARSDIRSVLPFSGKTVNAFSQIWAEGMEPINDSIDVANISGPELNSVSTMLMMGAIGSDAVNGSEITGSDWGRMFRFCGDVIPNTRDDISLDYLDEVLTLKMAQGSITPSEILKSRHDSGEDYIFESLYLRERTPS